MGIHCTVKCRNYESRNTEVFGSNGSVGTGHFVRYFRKSVTLGFLNAKFLFGNWANVRYSRKSVISESGTSDKSRNNDMRGDDVAMQASIEKSCYNDMSRNNDVVSVLTEAYRNFEISLY